MPLPIKQSSTISFSLLLFFISVRIIFIGLIVVCFFLFVRILVAWGIQLYPYKTFFTNGHREGDFIYEKYEYDQNYDKDKFYK